MFDRLAELETEMEKLEGQLSELYASGDQQAAAAAGRRMAELRPVVEAYRSYRTTETELAEAREMLTGEPDAEMREYLESEIATKQGALDVLDARLRELLVPRDPDDGKNVIVEIRGGEGGEEGNLWARDLWEMYQRYADLHRWKVETLDSQLSDMGGVREVTFVVKG
ncbi:MAG: PCRF domain-containing protein, partial [Chloroflexota bacterium]